MSCNLPLASRDLPKVSVIIVAHNCLNYLSQCLRSLIKIDYPDFEIIYVDNGSTDDSVQYFKTNSRTEDRVLKLDHNYGFTRANNMGAQMAKGEYLAFLNVDTAVDTSWLVKLVIELEKDGNIGAAQPKLLQMNNQKIDSLGGFITPYGTVSSKGYGLPDCHVAGAHNIFYSKGAAMITRRKLWEAIGGFSPVFHLYYQETDYCWRLWSMGYRVVCVTDSTVWHVGGVVVDRLHAGLVKYYEAKERLALLLKNYSICRLLKYVPVTLCLQMANAARFLLRDDPVGAANILKGTISAFAHLRAIWRSRRDFSADKVSEDAILKKLMVPQIINSIRAE